MGIDFTKTTLNYPTGADTPIKRIRVNRAPTTSDYKNFIPGDEWLDSSSTDWWKFIEKNTSGGLWVKIGGTNAAVEKFQVDVSAGDNPVPPNSSNILTLTGAQTTAGSISNVIQTNSLSDNSISIQIQRSSATASTNSSLNGAAHFNSAHFSVDGNAFVSAAGAVATSYTTDSGSAIPAASVLQVLGQGTPNTSGIRATGTSNIINLSLYSPFEGDFAFSQSNAASATNRKLVVSNADTTAGASNAEIIMSVGGASSGDPYCVFGTASSRAYAIGSDTSDNSILKITTAASSTATPSAGNLLCSWDPAGSVTFYGGQVVHLTNPSAGSYPYTTLIEDYIILVDTSSPRGITLNSSLTGGTVHIIKDYVGNAAANNITLTPSAGTIDGAATYIINSNYGSATVVWDSGQNNWWVV